MPTRVTYTIEGTLEKGERSFGTKPAALMWLFDSAEKLGLVDITIQDGWVPDCVGYETDDLRRNLAFPECCTHYGSGECRCN